MGSYQHAIPIPNVIEKLRRLHHEGHEIVIFTARGMNTFKGNVYEVEEALRNLTEDWLEKYNVPYDQLIFGKPAADFYVDDKALNPFEFIDKNL